MADCDWVILCDHAFNDQQNKTCLIGIFDRLQIKHVPAALHKAFVVLKITGDPGEKVRFRIEIQRPTGAVLVKIEGESSLSATGSVTGIVALSNVQIPDWGPYPIQVYLNDGLAARTGFVAAEITTAGAPS